MWGWDACVARPIRRGGSGVDVGMGRLRRPGRRGKRSRDQDEGDASIPTALACCSLPSKEPGDQRHQGFHGHLSKYCAPPPDSTPILAPTLKRAPQAIPTSSNDGVLTIEFLVSIPNGLHRPFRLTQDCQPGLSTHYSGT